jgi:hypothetical protein
MGWLQWVVWQSQSSEELKLENFLPGKPQEISAKKDPEAFAAELEKMVARAKRREERKRPKTPLKPEDGLDGAPETPAARKTSIPRKPEDGLHGAPETPAPETPAQREETNASQ